MKVLLVIDSFDREYLAIRLLRHALERRGVVVRVSSRPVLTMAYNRFKPHAIVLPKTHKLPELEHMHRHAVIILMQAESFVGSLNAFRLMAPLLRKQFVDIACCWGEFDRNFYIGEKTFPADRIYVTGHPMTEAWHLKRSERLAKDKPVVGITFSLRGLTHKALGVLPNPIEAIISLEEAGDSGYFIPPYHAEDWIAFEASWLRIAYQIAKDNPDITFSLRPHPIENIDLYKAFQNKLSNVLIAPKGHISQWLRTVDVVCSAYSTSMLDAYFSGVSVLSLRNLIPARVKEGIHPGVTGIPHEDHFLAPMTYNELRERMLESWKPIEELDHLGRHVFNFNGNARPSECVADIIVEKTHEIYSKKESFAPVPERVSEKIFGKFSWSPDARMALLHFRDLIKNSRTTASSYCKHRFIHNSCFDDVYYSLIEEKKN